MSKRSAEGEPGEPGCEPPTKRSPSDSGGAGADPPPTTKKIVFEPLQLGPITNLEELDLKTLQFQNRYSMFLKQRFLRNVPVSLRFYSFIYVFI